MMEREAGVCKNEEIVKRRCDVNLYYEETSGKYNCQFSLSRRKACNHLKILSTANSTCFLPDAGRSFGISFFATQTDHIARTENS